MTHSVDKPEFSVYTTRINMKNQLLAQETQIICPQPYGGGVVCGIHTPVNTGLGDNLAVVGAVLLVTSLIFLVLSRKFKKVSA